MKTIEYHQYQAAVLEVFHKMPIADKEYTMDEDIKEYFRKSLLKSSLYASDEFFSKTYLTKSIIKLIKDSIGHDFLQFNKTAFYGSFKQTMEKSPLERVVDQVLHYMGTYGRESMGLEPIFIVPMKEIFPEEKITGDLKLITLENISETEIKAGCAKLIFSGVALSAKLQDAILTITKYLQIEWDVEEVNNKEFKMHLYSAMGTFPTAPEDFLRYVIFLQCGSTLLIRNKTTINNIKAAYNFKHQNIAPLFRAYIERHGEKPLASVFLRNKVLFLAFRCELAMRPIINRLRKAAIKYHKPMQRKVLDMLTSGENFSEQDLEMIKAELDRVSIYKKIAALNACRLYNSHPQKLVYKIRNGKAFVKKVDACKEKKNNYQVEQIIWDAIINFLGNKFTEQEYYLPPEIEYAVPTSEKDMLGAVPYGSILILPMDAIVGIHWINFEGERTDLDLSLTSNKECFNWNNWYDVKNNKPIYSGDMTDAPKKKNGASEAFYIPREYAKNLMLSVNNYTFWSMQGKSIPFEIFVGGMDNPAAIRDRNYLLSAHETVLAIKGEIYTGQQSIGIIETGEESRKLIIGAACFSENIVMSSNDVIADAVDALIHRYHTNLKLRELIERCGGIIVDTVGENTIELSLDKISKEQMLNFLVPDEVLNLKV